MSFFSRYRIATFLCVAAMGCSAADEGTESGEQEQEPTRAHDLAPAPALTSTSVDLPITVRGTGAATLRANVFANPAAPATASATILSIPGLGATAKVFDPLTAALFADPALGAAVKQVVTIDPVGHGASSVPTGLPEGVTYGDLTIEDGVDAIVQALRGLAAQGYGPQLIVSAGLGGLEVAAAQERLLAEGSSLAQIGVRSVLLYAPVPSSGRPWTLPATAATISQYYADDAARGRVYALAPEVWARSGFTTSAGTVVADGPSAAQVTELGLSAPEPVAVVEQLFETGTVLRPIVRAGAFAAENGTRLIAVGLSENTSVQPPDVADFYAHLTGDTTGARYVAITAPDAVANYFITQPALTLQATRAHF